MTERFTDDMPAEPVGIYQVWQKESDRFRHVFNVEAGNRLAALVLPAIDKGLEDYQRVTSLSEEIRPITFGDVIVNPAGESYELYKPEFGGAGFRKTEMPSAAIEIAAVENPIRPLTEQLINCAVMDIWPGRAAIVDFGIDSEQHLGALQFAIRNDLVTPQELDASMGNGAKLTEIAQRGQNPYRDVVFKTSWDNMFLEPPEEPGPEETKAIFAEMRADEHAARVRDYGEVDAATYEQRVRDGASTVQHLEPLPTPSTAAEVEQAVSAFESSWRSNQTEATFDEKSKFSAIMNGKVSPEVKQEKPSQEKSRDDGGREM